MNTVAGRQDEDSPKLQTMLNIMKVLLKLSREHTEIFEGDLQNILSLSVNITYLLFFSENIPRCPLKVRVDGEIKDLNLKFNNVTFHFN